MPATIFSPIIEPLSEPAFVRALLDVSVVAVVAGIVGTFIVLRGTGFLGDALAHAIFPGVVIAFLIEASLLGGALVAGLLTAALMGVLAANTRVRSDSAIGVVFTAAFALGVILISREAIEGEELEHILFGDPLNATWRDVIITAVIGAAVAVTVLLLRRLFVVASFDPAGARAMGLPVVALDVLLLVLTALTVVIAFKAVGNILVIALLITPAAAARLLTDRLVPTMLLACAMGVVSGVIGTYVGWHRDVSVGGTVVLTCAVVFFVVWLVAPRHGILSGVLIRREAARSGEEPEAEAEVILSSQQIRAPHEA